MTIRKIWHRLQVFSELVAFEHTIFSASFILIAMVVSSNAVNDNGFFGFKVLFLCVIALVSARNFAMAFNRFCDRDIDITNNRTKNRPSVDGRISVISLLAFCILNIIAFVLVSYFINDLAFMLSVPFLIIIGFYSLMKRFSYLAHWVLGLSLGLAPLAGDIAVSGDLHIWTAFLCLGVLFWVAGFDLIYSLQDIEHDKANGLYSVPSRFGLDNALSISRISHILAIFCWAIFLRCSQTYNLAIIGLLLAAIMLVYEHVIVCKDLHNIPKAFFVTNGYLGFVFLFFIILDSVVRF